MAMPVLSLIFSVGDGHDSWWGEVLERLLFLCAVAIAAHKAWRLRKHAPRVSAVGIMSVGSVLAFATFAHGLMPIGLLTLLVWQVWSERHCHHT
jgi:hypothetical protein